MTQTQIKVSAFVYRGPVNRERTAESLQAKADDLRLVGQYDAADAASNAAGRLRRERKPMEVMPETLRLALGPRDPIASLIKDRVLSVGHARIALALRDHEQGETISIQGGMDLDRVDGKSAAGPESKCDARRTGRYAWDRAQDACEPSLWGPVCKVIRGQAGVARAARSIGRDTPRGRDACRHNLIESLNAAGAYLGVAV